MAFIIILESADLPNQSEGSMKAFVDFLVNKKRLEDQQKEAKQIQDEERKKEEQEIEQNEPEDVKKKSSNILSKLTGGITGHGQATDQNGEIIKLQYENLALKIDQVMTKIENTRPSTATNISEDVDDGHHSFDTLDYQMPRAQKLKQIQDSKYEIRDVPDGWNAQSREPEKYSGSEISEDDQDNVFRHIENNIQSNRNTNDDSLPLGLGHEINANPMTLEVPSTIERKDSTGKNSLFNSMSR